MAKNKDVFYSLSGDSIIQNRSLSEVETSGIATSLNAQRQKALNNSVVLSPKRE
jgi:hypothetical protein